MDWFNPLPGSIGWIATAVLVIGFFFVWRTFRKRKADHVSKIWPSFTILGFGGVNVPKQYWAPEGVQADNLSLVEAHKIGGAFAATQYEVWKECLEIYDVPVETLTNRGFGQAERGWCVDELSVVVDPALNPQEDVLAFFGIRLRAAF